MVGPTRRKYMAGPALLDEDRRAVTQALRWRDELRQSQSEWALVRGSLRDDPGTRQELFSLVG